MTAHRPEAPADGGAVAAFLAADEGKSLLRFLTCGSVDDGKSTLIGRLLYDSRRLFEDQLAALKADSDKYGTDGSNIDFALLVDGLVAEREQGITIDVAYRYFATDKRRFIVADTPGHVQYTRNMATGASTSDLAVLLVDAGNGILTQTRRHAYIVSLLGIRHVVLAVNKIDLVGYAEKRFAEIAADFAAFAAPLGFAGVVAIPMSARHGDNVIARSARTPWYGGPTLLDHLETVDVADSAAERPFRLPVQWVNRPDATFRGYAGTVAAGTLREGDPFIVARTGQTARIARIVTMAGDLAEAPAGAAITVTADREIDIGRGDVMSPPDSRPEVSDQIAAHVIWMAEEPLLPGRSYLLKAGARTVGAAVSELKHQVDIDDTFKPLAAKTLALNDIGLCNLSLSEPIAFDPYVENRTTGSFILIDRFSNATVAAGMIRFGLRRATNIHWQALDVDKRVRAEAMGQRPVVLWFTGLSGAGKSTVANLVEKKLHLLGRHTYLLDGDNVRHGLNRDLGFTDADRVENIRRVAETAKLFVDAGLIVLVSFISPFRSERDMARELVEPGEFLEVFVDAPLDVAEARDPKGLYKKARAGEIRNFTGIDSPYEPPSNPDVRLDTTSASADDLAETVIARLRADGHLGRL
ncbi:MAG: sulfate adenylyltransferase subunit CysN [Bauldia sp.]|nr:sulfate adenylyltransferase subunit CysN [Bauldia sp.]